MDVILNRAPLLAVTGNYKKGKKGDGMSTDVDLNVVCPIGDRELSVLVLVCLGA